MRDSIAQATLDQNTWREHTARTAAFYNDLVGRFGHDPRACDYGSAESQRRKFEILAEALPARPVRLLDVGCGFADFADYLSTDEREIEYCGVDLCEQMIAEARRTHPMLDLRQMDILTDAPAGAFDVVTANGIFYLIRHEPTETMRAIIRRLFELSSYAVAFTSLSTRSPVFAAGEFYADPVETLAFCQSLTPYVVLRHDYLPHDFAVYMYREQPR